MRHPSEARIDLGFPDVVPFASVSEHNEHSRKGVTAPDSTNAQTRYELTPLGRAVLAGCEALDAHGKLAAGDVLAVDWRALGELYAASGRLQALLAEILDRRAADRRAALRGGLPAAVRS